MKNYKKYRIKSKDHEHSFLKDSSIKCVNLKLGIALQQLQWKIIWNLCMKMKISFQKPKKVKVINKKDINLYVKIRIHGESNILH